jgi:hypothetical protein
VIVQHGLEERRTPGNTLAVQPDKPYQGLSMFGTGTWEDVGLRGRCFASISTHWQSTSWQSTSWQSTSWQSTS